jgi:hypothetical protein
VVVEYAEWVEFASKIVNHCTSESNRPSDLQRRLRALRYVIVASRTEDYLVTLVWFIFTSIGLRPSLDEVQIAVVTEQVAASKPAKWFLMQDGWPICWDMEATFLSIMTAR